MAAGHDAVDTFESDEFSPMLHQSGLRMSLVLGIGGPHLDHLAFEYFLRGDIFFSYFQVLTLRIPCWPDVIWNAGQETDVLQIIKSDEEGSMIFARLDAHTAKCKPPAYTSGWDLTTWIAWAVSKIERDLRCPGPAADHIFHNKPELDTKGGRRRILKAIQYCHFKRYTADFIDEEY